MTGADCKRHRPLAEAERSEVHRSPLARQRPLPSVEPAPPAFTRASDPAEGTERIATRYKRLRVETFALTWLAYASYYLCRKNLSVVKSTLASEGLSNTDLGTIDTGFLLFYALGQFGNGLLCDRIGARWVVGVGLIATAALNIAFGTGEHLLFFVIAYALNGLAQSAGWPGCAKTFARWFSQRERGTIMGFWCTCYQVGPMVATALATWLLGHYGWRFAFFGPALLVAGFGVIFLVRQKASPESVGLPDIETYHAEGGGHPVTAPRASPSIGEQASWEERLGILRDHVIWVLGLTYVVLKFIRYSFLFWLPFFMSQQLGYSATEAGFTSLAFDLAGLLGAVFAGVMSDRIFGTRRAPIVVLMMIALAVATYFYGSADSLTKLQNILGIAAIGFFVYGPDTVASGVAAVDRGSRSSAATAAGFVNGLGSFGAMISPLVIGYVSEHYGWRVVLTLFAPLSLAGALLMATLWRQTTRAPVG